MRMCTNLKLFQFAEVFDSFFYCQNACTCAQIQKYFISLKFFVCIFHFAEVFCSTFSMSKRTHEVFFIWLFPCRNACMKFFICLFFPCRNACTCAPAFGIQQENATSGGWHAQLHWFEANTTPPYCVSFVFDPEWMHARPLHSCNL